MNSNAARHDDRYDSPAGRFPQWFGSFVTTPRHELDIAPAEPPYEEEEVVDALLGGESSA
jgi:ribosomal protein L16 Arg81 hydroxylase